MLIALAVNQPHIPVGTRVDKVETCTALLLSVAGWRVDKYEHTFFRQPLTHRNPRHRLHLPLWLGAVIPLYPHFFPEDGASIASIRGPFSASRYAALPALSTLPVAHVLIV